MAGIWSGRSLGGYRITEKIGSGGMGEVYRAVQASTDRKVAIKILLPVLADDPVLVARFRQEARVIAALEHPHILPLIDFGDDEGVLYLVTRYLSGGTLHDLIQSGPIPPPTVLRYLAEVGKALDYAHSQGIIHRDIKPSNILLDSQGNPFLADFGLAKTMNTAGLTQGGLGLGTPLYMSPEQGRIQPVDHRSDIYSLGVVMYEMLTRRALFEAENMMGIIMKHINDPVPSVTGFGLALPRAFDAVFARALAKKPADRYATVREFAENFARAIETPDVFDLTLPLPPPTPVDATPASPPEAITPLLTEPLAPPAPLATQSPAQRRWLVLGLVGAAAALAGVFLGQLFLAAPAAQGTPSPVVASQPVAPTSGQSTQPASTPGALPPTATPLGLTSPTPVPTLIVAAQDAMELVYVPAGSFRLGSADDDPEAQPDEKPQQTVHLDAFWIDRTEVSVAQFQDFVNATNYQTDAELGCCAGEYARAGGLVFAPDPQFVKSANWKLPEGQGAAPALPRRPVVQVSWNDAKAYCKWAGRRLPTETEWEKAARGDAGRLYPWGKAFDGARLNFCDRRCPREKHDANYDDAFARSGNVGSFPAGASPYGLLDMSGNVREWVSDRYDPRGYAAGPPPTAEGGPAYVLRGGSWFDPPARVRAAARSANVSDARDNTTGFRCAISAADLGLP